MTTDAVLRPAAPASATAPPSLPTPDRTATTPHPVREVVVFLAVVAACLAATTSTGLALGVDVSRIDEAPPLGQAVMFGQALIPLLAAVVARLAGGGSLRRPGWGVRRTSWRSVVAAWGLGLGVVAVGSGGLVLAGVLEVAPDARALTLLLGVTVLVLPYLLLALAEDVGWRGVLVERLAQRTGPVGVVLVSGLAWSLFHYPLMIWLGGRPDGVPLAFTLVAWTVGCTAYAALLACLQLRHGIWPGVVVHAVVNAAAYHVVAPLTVGTDLSGWLAGETGAVGALVMVGAAALVWRVLPLRRAADGRTVSGTRSSVVPV